jgi:hypothetical protein
MQSVMRERTAELVSALSGPTLFKCIGIGFSKFYLVICHNALNQNSYL